MEQEYKLRVDSDISVGSDISDNGNGFDGIVGRVSIFLDAIQIVDDGQVCHPDLKSLAYKLIGN